MKTTKVILTLALLTFTLGWTGTLQAQDAESREKIKSLQVAFFTERLELTPQEAAIFWPMYNDYEKKKEELRSQERSEIYDKLASGKAFAEPEAQGILDRYLELEQQQDALDRSFYRELSRTLSASKTLALFRAEHEFRRKLLREYRKRHGNMP